MADTLTIYRNNVLVATLALTTAPGGSGIRYRSAPLTADIRGGNVEAAINDAVRFPVRGHLRTGQSFMINLMCRAIGGQSETDIARHKAANIHRPGVDPLIDPHGGVTDPRIIGPGMHSGARAGHLPGDTLPSNPPTPPKGGKP